MLGITDTDDDPIPGDPLDAILDATADHPHESDPHRRLARVCEWYLAIVDAVMDGIALSLGTWTHLTRLVSNTWLVPPDGGALAGAILEERGAAKRRGVGAGALAARVEAIGRVERIALMEVMDRHWVMRIVMGHDTALKSGSVRHPTEDRRDAPRPRTRGHQDRGRDGTDAGRAVG